MLDHPQTDPIPENPIAERFYSGALNRIRRFMVVLAAPLVAVTAWKFGIRSAIGLAIGCLIAYINFYWLKRVISGFVDRAAGSPTKQSSDGIVFRFVLRYVLMAAAAYVILTVSPASLNGLLAGLFLPVAAIACEAVYEVYAALVRGM
jgi:small-conductance mechanosensitive channel